MKTRRLLAIVAFSSLLLFAGTKTVLSVLTVGILNNKVYVDGTNYARTTAGINAAAAALGSGGGIIELSAGTYTIDSQVTALNTATKPVDLRIPGAAILNVTDTTSTDCVIPIANGSGVDGLGAPSSANQGTTGGFVIASTASIKDLFCNADVTGSQELFHINGTHVIGTSGETITGAIYEVQGVFTNTVLRDNYTEAISTASGTVDILRIRPGTGGLKVASDVALDNNNFDCTGGAGCVPVDIEGVASSNISHIRFHGGDIQHGGSGKNTLLINGNGVTSGIYDIIFENTHFEAYPSGGAACMAQITDATHVVIDQPTPTGNSTTAFCISQSGAGLTHNIEIRQIRQGGGYTNLINNTITSKLITGTDLADYLYSGKMVLDSSILAAQGIVPTLSGTGACATQSTQVGGSWAGTFVCTGTTGASTVKITPGNTATNGFQCDASDETTGNTLRQSAHDTASCTISGTVNANDVIVFKVGAAF